MSRKITALIFTLFLFPSTLLAEELAKLHEVFGDWNVLTTNDNQGNKVCYIASVPAEKAGNYKNRGDAYVLVSTFSDKSEEINLTSGYPYKQGSTADINIDGRHKYELKTEGNLAWARTSNDDKKIISFLKRGNKMKVKGVSKLGTYSIDEYSLKGFTAAYNNMKSLCK